jgi:hypothetical protein
MIEIASGHAAIDRYLAGGYSRVRGMSSRFAAAICGHLIRRQTEQGISGEIVEVGTFEGRFFIALALGLAPSEHAFGLDIFSWPDDGVMTRLVDNCVAAGLARDCFTPWKQDSQDLQIEAFRAKLSNRPARFIHIDGEHSQDCLRHDLDLAHAVLHPSGIIVLDDMLHPAYPMLIAVVIDYLTRHPEMRVLCIVDREDISAAAKFLLCRAEAVALYEQDLMTTFERFHYIVGADVLGRLALVLTPDPRLADIG